MHKHFTKNGDSLVLQDTILCPLSFSKTPLQKKCFFGIDEPYMFPILVRYVICWHPVYIHNKNLLVNQPHAHTAPEEPILEKIYQ